MPPTDDSLPEATDVDGLLAELEAPDERRRARAVGVPEKPRNAAWWRG